MSPDSIPLRLPGFLRQINAQPLTLAEPAARMAFVIDLARRNAAADGGPFAAAVFERESGRLVAAGANRVLASRSSLAHAEMVALALAQQSLATHDLGAPELPAHELVSSVEPCLMCLGGVLWSGVQALICGARDEDARAVGFDEGPKPGEWVAQFAQRGIAVQRDLLREEAVAVLRDYAAAGGCIYNPSR